MNDGSNSSLSLHVTEVSKTYQGNANVEVRALQDVSLEVYAGEIVCLLGPSGCGKSTLLKILADLDSDFEGEVELKGHASHRSRVTYMPQDDCLLPWRSVESNARLGMELGHCDQNVMQAQVAKHLQLVGLSDWSARYPSELSGGMRQRVALARTLSLSASLILLDEPLSKLDFVNRQRLAEFLREYVKREDSIGVVVTHSVEEAVLIANRVVVLAGSPGVVRTVLHRKGTTVRPTVDSRQCDSEGEMFDRIVEAFESEE